MENSIFNLSVEWTRKETANMRLIRLKQESPLQFIPGQVMVLGKEGIEGSYFSIASAPQDIEGLDFLVNHGKGMADYLLSVNLGERIQCKGPIGKGFPVNEYYGRDLLMVAVGSALAPLRSVIWSVISRRNRFGNLSLVYGARTLSDIPLSDEMKEWEQSKIVIMPILSRAETGIWKGKTGHVQEHFEEAIKGLNHPVALIGGMPDMVTQSREKLLRLGIDPDEILTNY